MREVDVIGALRALGGSATVYELCKNLEVSVPTIMKYLQKHLDRGSVGKSREVKNKPYIYRLNPVLRVADPQEPSCRVSLRKVVSISIRGSEFELTIEEARDLAAELNSVIGDNQVSEPLQAPTIQELEDTRDQATRIQELKAQWKRVREELRRWAGVSLTRPQIMGVVQKHVSGATWIKAKKNLVSTNTIARREGIGWMVLNPRDRKTR